MQHSPVILFVYNRPQHTKRTVEALKKNIGAQDTELFIFSDGAKNETHAHQVNNVRFYLRGLSGFRKIHLVEREENFGLARSVIEGVSQVINTYGQCIVLEDDLVTSSYFLTFMNDALEQYAPDDRIFTISGYKPPIELPENFNQTAFLSHRSSTWGWGTWKQEWNSIEWSHDFYKPYAGKVSIMKEFAAHGGNDRIDMLKMQLRGSIDSWAIRRGFTQFLQKKFTVFPAHNLVSNIGHDGSGTHSRTATNFEQTNPMYEKPLPLPDQIEEDQRIHERINRYYNISPVDRIKAGIKKIMGS